MPQRRKKANSTRRRVSTTWNRRRPRITLALLSHDILRNENSRLAARLAGEVAAKAHSHNRCWIGRNTVSSTFDVFCRCVAKWYRDALFRAAFSTKEEHS